MASLNLSIATASFLCFIAFLVLPASSLSCTSQKFANKVFANCSDLPTLGSYLHWTYNATNSSLSIAFVAAPAKSGGWISWGINPNGTGMAGTQSLIAFKSNGSVVVKTYDLVSYGNISQSALSFAVWDLEAQDVDGEMAIFASVKVPEAAESVNQVWQVGPSVSSGGAPAKHAFEKENLDSKSALALSAAAKEESSGTGSPAESPAPSPNSTGSSTTNSTGGAARTGAGLILSTAAIVGLLLIN